MKELESTKDNIYKLGYTRYRDNPVIKNKDPIPLYSLLINRHIVNGKGYNSTDDTMCLEHSDISSNRRILVHPDIFSIILQRETNCKRKRINDNKYTKKFSYLYNWKKR